MKIAFITAGAAGMFCGSCMHDNTLASFLIKAGHDALLIPTYTPIRTDEEDVSQKQVFFGGINVYLQQKSWLFRHTPRFIDRLFNFRALLRWVSRFAVNTKYSEQGDLTISLLQGEEGKQKKEVHKLVDFLETDFEPDVVLLTNVLLSGMVPAIQKRLGKPIIGMLQGDDIFLQELPEKDRLRCLQLIRQNAESMAGFIATSSYYADFMADYLGIARPRIEVVHPGLNLQGHRMTYQFREPPTPTIGYFARICPEKGLHQLIDAYVLMRQRSEQPCHLQISGWLGDNHKPYFDQQMKKIHSAGFQDEVRYVASPDHESKVRFFQSIDLLSVPTTYREPKGLYLLESLANGVPVVQPRHGSFPELIEQTQGGLLVEPDSVESLADGLQQMIENAELRRSCGQKGFDTVHRQFTAPAMAAETIRKLERFVQ